MSTPIVIRSGRGVLHRAVRDSGGAVVVHPRCMGGRTGVKVEVVHSAMPFTYEVLRHPSVLCHYSWCFQALLREMGLDSFVGHRNRYIPQAVIEVTS